MIYGTVGKIEKLEESGRRIKQADEKWQTSAGE